MATTKKKTPKTVSTSTRFMTRTESKRLYETLDTTKLLASDLIDNKRINVSARCELKKLINALNGIQGETMWAKMSNYEFN